MNMQSLAIGPDRVIPAQIKQAIEKLAMGANRSETAYELRHTGEFRPNVPSYPSQLARRNGRPTMNTLPFVGGDKVVAQCYGYVASRGDVDIAELRVREFAWPLFY